MAEVEAEHCDDRCGSLCQHLPKAEGVSLPCLCPQDGWKHPIPEEGLGRALWRTSTWSTMRGEETCCSRTIGKSWNCIEDRSCWSNRCLCLCPCLGLCLGLYRGLCPGRGCFVCGCCCYGGCENGGGCGASGGCGHLIGSPSCRAGTLCRPCGLSGDGSDGNGTWRKNLCPAGGGKMTFWSQSPLPHSAPLSLCHGPGLCLTLGAVHIGRREVAEAWRSGV